MLLGGYLTLLIGPTVPIPAPEYISKSIQQVSVNQSEESRSGFQITFRMGRDSFSGAVDFLPLLTQQIKVGHRVVIMAVLDARPHVIMDGLITQLQLSPGAEPGSSTLSVSGSDISQMMELVEAQTPWPAHNAALIVQQILARYLAFMQPIIVPPVADNPEVPTEQTPTTTGNDYQVITGLARQFDYIFTVRPGPLPGMNIAYFGPPIPFSGLPQSALTFRMGAATNLGSIQFTQEGDTPHFLYGLIQDNNTGAPVPVAGIPMPPTLSAMPAYVGNAPLSGLRLVQDDHGGDIARAIPRATARMAEANRRAIKASGELDVLRYGKPLQAGALVGVRGVGLTHDGMWVCKSVSHTISRGSYKQSFQLERDGTISNTPVVPV